MKALKQKVVEHIMSCNALQMNPDGLVLDSGLLNGIFIAESIASYIQSFDMEYEVVLGLGDVYSEGLSEIVCNELQSRGESCTRKVEHSNRVILVTTEIESIEEIQRVKSRIIEKGGVVVGLFELLDNQRNIDNHTIANQLPFECGFSAFPVITFEDLIKHAYGSFKHYLMDYWTKQCICDIGVLCKEHDCVCSTPT